MNKAILAITSWLMSSLCLADNFSDKDLEDLNNLLNNETIKNAVRDHHNVAVAIVVPVAFFLFIFGIIFVGFYMRYKKSRDLQTTIRLMVEKGAPVPMELIVEPENKSSYDIRRGLILTFIGITLPVAMAVSNPGDKDWVWGLIPLAIGLAYLISARVSKIVKNG